MGNYLEFGTGYSSAGEGFTAGKKAAEIAFRKITKYNPTMVMVSCSGDYNLQQVLQGVREISGETPLVGGTSAGEICRGFHVGSVAVSILASPYISVHIGVGRDLSLNYRRAVEEAINTSGGGDYFGEYHSKDSMNELELNYARKTFALVFLPGVPLHQKSYSAEVIDMLRKRSLNAFPIVGTCTGDGLRWEKTYQFHNGEVISDCFILAIVETHLKFGTATFVNHRPTILQASITKVNGHDIMELNDKPAANYYAKLINVKIDDLRKDPLKYFIHNPMGICDDFGNYSILMGQEITPDNGIRCLKKPYPNMAVTVMKVGSEELEGSSAELVVKTMSRGKINKPLAFLVFSSVYRMNIYSVEGLQKEVRDSVRALRKSNLFIDYAGLIGYGEIGVNDEGVSRYFDYSITGLMIADELNSVSAVAFRNKILYEELSDTAIRNQVLYEELAAVHRLSNLLNSSLNLKFIINTAVETIGDFFQADGSAALVYDKRKDSFPMMGFYHNKRPPRKINWKKTIEYYVASKGKPVIISNANKDSDYREEEYNEYVSKDLMNITGAKSIICSPVTGGEEIVGVICAYSRQADFFNEDKMQFLQTLSSQIGTAIVNARLFQRTRLLACTDGLTGLYDHNYFLKNLSRLLLKAIKKKTNLSLIMIDLNDFKYCNDKYGHTVGDVILKETADVLRHNVRNDDIIARYGGDEFVVILANASKELAFQIAERIRCEISRMIFTDPEENKTFGITASIGIATFPDDALTARTLIDSADQAMYRVKRQVKNKSEMYLSDFTELEKEFTASEKAFFDTIKVLIQLLDSRDRYTWEHSRQVASYAVKLAGQMGMTDTEKYHLRLTGYLHDIGKIHVQSEIVNKKGPLTEDEFASLKLHPVVGANLLAPITELRKIIPIVYHHHEWYDGSGYPDGLKGEDIPISARILTVVDGFDAMTSNRPYRKAQPVEWAVEELISKKGIQYDPEIVDAFVKWVNREMIEPSRSERRKA
ncbi:diguanylate cyclase [Phosphitispora fastidiosa]|uniref:diguanylate cyclase n=1 Tax=Phosphitispora fastidiosa TaxID=2837202 RepID=UPI001E44085D|nr:diguanylate cyclase [Phosphitispora fastidiosa]MBU7007188.1 diguanylate cyclase (GGDEF)-like protein/putative nucleotidyltransferase with HDIG domain [Phosphitispora fastidiosa]